MALLIGGLVWILIFQLRVFLWHNRWFFVFTFRELVCIFLCMSWIYLYLRLLWMGLSIPCAVWVNIFMSYYYPNFIFHPRCSSKWSFLLVIIYMWILVFFIFYFSKSLFHFFFSVSILLLKFSLFCLHNSHSAEVSCASWSRCDSFNEKYLS